jgi:RNA polymerase sigma factor (sigma-70 family)
MADANDMDLVREYADRNSESAFAELVRRHINLVYSVALRFTGNSGDAQDVTQAVFIIFTRKAASLRQRTILTGWLYETTRLTAAGCLRTRARRQAHEQEAFMQSTLDQPGTDNVWRQLAPHLEAGMSRLAEHDRTLLALRFYENKTGAEAAALMGIREEAAHKRTARALEKLRKFFTKRGVTLSSVAIAGAVSANSVQAAPVGLTAKITAAATTIAGTAVTTTIVMTTLQKIAVTAALAVSVGVGIYQAKEAANARAEVQTLQQQQAPLAEQIQQLQRERDEATNLLARMAGESAKNQSDNNELLKLRAEVTRQKSVVNIESDPAFQQARLWLAKEDKLRQQFAEHPDQWIPEMKFLTSEDWLDQARKADLDSAAGIRCALSNIRVAAAFNFAQKINQALNTYMITHNQQLPESTSELDSYFRPPVDDADTILSRYEMLDSKELANPAYQGAAITQKTLVDHIDRAVLIGTKNVTSISTPNWPTVIPDELEPVVKAYADANNEGFLTFYDLEPYATTAAQKDALNKIISAANK